jgi:hypothetical protein
MVMTNEEMIEKKKAYYQKNKEKIRQYQNQKQIEYYEKNKSNPEFMKRKSEISLKYYYKVKNNKSTNDNNDI